MVLPPGAAVLLSSRKTLVMMPSWCPWRLSPVGQQRRLNVTLVGPVLPVAEVGVTERVAEERDHALLDKDFPLADGVHDAGPKVGIT